MNRRSTSKRNEKSKGKPDLDRRTFVKTLPALGVAGLAVSNLPLSSLAQTPSPTPTPTTSPSASPAPSPTPAPRITKEMLHTAEKLFGIEFTDAQEAMALNGVNRNLDSYETIRKIDIPLDTEPAIAFHPLRRKELYGPRTKFRFGKVDRKSVV